MKKAVFLDRDGVINKAIVWHLIVSHPKLKLNETKWESVSKK